MITIDVLNIKTLIFQILLFFLAISKYKRLQIYPLPPEIQAPASRFPY
jgi:hypothetical protein